MKRLIAGLVAVSFASFAEGPPPPPPPEPGFALRVHLLSPDQRVQLRRAISGEPVVCTAPCDQVINLQDNESFTLGGPGLATSSEFNIRPRDGDLTLQIRPAPSGPRTAAKFGIAVGALVTFAGSVTGSIVERDCTLGGGCNDRHLVDQGVTGGLLIAGALTVLISVIALTQLPTTEYDVVPQ